MKVRTYPFYMDVDTLYKPDCNDIVNFNLLNMLFDTTNYEYWYVCQAMTIPLDEDDE